MALIELKRVSSTLEGQDSGQDFKLSSRIFSNQKEEGRKYLEPH